MSMDIRGMVSQVGTELENDILQLIRAGLEHYVEPGEWTEIRTFQPGTESRWFSDLDAAASYALGQSKRKEIKAVYFIPNPIDPESLVDPRDGIAYKIKPGLPDKNGRVKIATQAEDILRRYWLLIDVDPERKPKASNATDGERAAAGQVMDAVMADLHGRGFMAPMLASSGNGWHCVYPIDLPSNDGSREQIRAFLHGLQSLYGTAAAKVDVLVFDAPRIWKTIGTITRKGRHTAERPQRRAGVVGGYPTREDCWAARPTNNVAMVNTLQDWLASGVNMTGTKAQASPAPAAAAPTRSTPSSTSVLDRARAYAAKIAPAISGQQGHTAMVVAAGKVIHGFDLSVSDTVHVMSEYNARCVPPFSDAEFTRKIDEADAKSWDKPRGHLRDEPRKNDRQVIGSPGSPSGANTVGHLDGGHLDGSKNNNSPIGTLHTHARATEVAATTTEEHPPVLEPQWGWRTETLDKVRPIPINWIVRAPDGRGFLPAGLSALCGDGGAGKSTLIRALMAQITSGEGPFFVEGLGDALIVVSEDDEGSVILPHILSCGGDPRRIHCLRGTTSGPKGTPQPTPEELMSAWLDDHPEVKLVVLDVLASWASDRNMDLNKATDCRALLDPLNKMAQKRGVAIVILHHNTKNTMSSALHKVSGSAQIVNACRIVWIAGKSRDESHRTCAYTKGNLVGRSKGFNYTEELVSPQGVKDYALEFGITFDGDFDAETFRKLIALDGPVSTADEVAAGPMAGEPGINTKGAACLAWLKEVMEDAGQMLDKPLTELAAQEGFTGGTLKRAKAQAREAGWLRAGKLDNQWMNYFTRIPTVQQDHETED